MEVAVQSTGSTIRGSPIRSILRKLVKGNVTLETAFSSLSKTNLNRESPNQRRC